MSRFGQLYGWFCAAAVLGLCLGPTAYLLAVTAGELDGAAWRGLFSGRELRMLGRTVGMAGVATLAGGVVGTAFAAARRRSPRWSRGTLALLAPLPLLVPPYLTATAWTRLLGGPDTPLDIYGWVGSGLVLGFCYFPLVALPVGTALDAIGGGARDAGRLLLPRAIDRLRLVAGGIRPHLLGGMALVFPLAAANLAVPMILRSNVYPLEVFTQFSANYDVPRAVLSALPLIGLALGVLLARQLLLARAPGRRIGGHWRPDRTEHASRLALAGAAGILLLTFGLPVGVLARDVEGLAQFERSLATAGDEVFVSLRVSAVAALLMTAIGLGYGRWLAGRPRPQQFLLGGLGLLPLVMPGAAVGLGLQVLTRDGWLPRVVYDTELVLALAATARFVSFAILLGWAATERIGPRHAEAAWLAGLSPGRRLLRIELPLIAPELLAALAFSFSFAMGELAAAVLVKPPGSETLAARLVSLLHFGEDGIVSSLCLVLAFLVVIVMAIVSLVANRVLELRLDVGR